MIPEEQAPKTSAEKPQTPEKSLSPEESLLNLKTEITAKLSPHAKNFINYFSEKYRQIRKTDLAKALGIIPVQLSADQSKEKHNPPELSNPETKPQKELLPGLSIEELQKSYSNLENLRATTAISSETRQDIFKQLNQALQFAPNFLQMKLKSAEQHNLDTVEQLGIKMNTFAPLIDLSAFDLTKLRTGRLNLDLLKQRGIKEMVLMEDRDPQFFLNYQEYNPNQTVPLNRHGNPDEKWTMNDLKKLTEQLHQVGIKVTIGFWGNAENAGNNEFIKKNWQQLHPMIPGSSDINPLAMVQNAEGKTISFAEYIVEQYQKLHRDFGFDGLFLGDGLMGYRDFKDPQSPADFSSTAPLWTDFYQKIHSGVHHINPGGKLWAYDVMGKSGPEALQHGIDQQALAPYLDTYVFQAYGSDAWGQDYMKLPGYNLSRDQKAISEIPPALAAKTKYTMAFGDQVEGWHSSKSSIKEKHQALAAHAKQGSFGVWSNQIIRNLA